MNDTGMLLAINRRPSAIVCQDPGIPTGETQKTSSVVGRNSQNPASLLDKA
jgi:hypothetical protein